MTDTRNPLPKADDNSRLQRQSLVSLQEILPKDLFIFRDERVDDAGVDGSLEILIDGCYTNMRAQFQLKSTAERNARQDGVMTFPIETSNFNYLLNGPLGLYILYIEKTNNLYYAWAADENRRRIEIKSDWSSQESISIPLQEINKLEISKIYKKIRLESELRREIVEALAHAPTNDNISVSISPETLKIENSVEIEKVLNSAGMTLVASGYSNLVLEKLKLISQKASSEARFKLIGAYANHSTGRYQLAIGEVSEAIISNDLRKEDQKFAKRIHLACQANLGMVTTAQYFQEVEAIAVDDELESAEITLERLVDQFRSQMERDDKVLNEIQELKDKVINSDKAPNSLKLGVRIKYLEGMGFDAIREIFSEIFKASARRNSRIHVSLGDQIADLRNALCTFKEWDNEASILIQDSIAVGHPIFSADAFVTKAFISLMGIVSKIAFMESEESPLDHSIIQSDVLLILGWCEKAQKTYQQANMLEGDVRTQLIMAQAFEVMGQMESAKNLAQGVLGKAKLLGYKRHIDTASEVIEGRTLFFRHIQSIREILRQKESDEYDPSVLETEEDIQDYVNFMMETYKIPEQRRENVVVDILCMRETFIEKSLWCKHIEIHQNLTHTLSSAAIYAENPNRRAVCSKFDYFVDKLSLDWVDLIKDVKNMYCSNCLDREPGNTTTVSEG
jgi:hypothetical protein